MYFSAATYDRKLLDEIERQVNQFESSINGKLPLDYRDFLVELESLVAYKTNKGEFYGITDLYYYLKENKKSFPLYRYYEIPDGKGIAYICNIYGLSEFFKPYQITSVMDLDLSSGFVPFADNGCGDYIAICVKKDGYGKIFMWNHETQYSKEGRANF